MIGRAFPQIRRKLPSPLRNLHKQLILTDHAENLSVAVDSILTEHLPISNLSCLSHLIRCILNKFQTGCHDKILSFRPETGGALKPPDG